MKVIRMKPIASKYEIENIEYSSSSVLSSYLPRHLLSPIFLNFLYKPPPPPQDVPIIEHTFVFQISHCYKFIGLFIFSFFNSAVYPSKKISLLKA